MTVVTRHDYFDAAMDLLAREGFRAVKISTLCARFGVTAGSFYHYFDNVDRFVDELLDYWEQQQTQRIEDLAAMPATAEARVERMKRLVLDLPHSAEAAIRAWAFANQQVATALSRIDEHRRRALQNVLEGVLTDRATARQMSITGMTMLIGAQQWRRPLTRSELVRLLDQFDHLVRTSASIPSLQGLR